MRRAWPGQPSGWEFLRPIVMPRDAPQVKLDATQALGAEIVLYERPGEDRDEVAAQLLREEQAARSSMHSAIRG